MLSTFQTFPATFQVMYQLPILRWKCWLIQWLTLCVDVEVQCFNLTAFLVPEEENNLTSTTPVALRAIFSIRVPWYYCISCAQTGQQLTPWNTIFSITLPCKPLPSKCSISQFATKLLLYSGSHNHHLLPLQIQIQHPAMINILPYTALAVHVSDQMIIVLPQGSFHYEAVKSYTHTYSDYLMTVTWDGSCYCVPVKWYLRSDKLRNVTLSNNTYQAKNFPESRF